jgi:hypothetical protein
MIKLRTLIWLGYAERMGDRGAGRVLVGKPVIMRSHRRPGLGWGIILE